MFHFVCDDSELVL